MHFKTATVVVSFYRLYQRASPLTLTDTIKEIMFFSPFKIALLAAWALWMIYFEDGGLLIVGIGLCAYCGIALLYHLLQGADLSWVIGLIAAFGLLILALSFVVRDDNRSGMPKVENEQNLDNQWENGRRN